MNHAFPLTTALLLAPLATLPSAGRDELPHSNDAGCSLPQERDYMLNNKDELRRVVKLWQDPPPPNENKEPEKEAAAHKSLQAVFDGLGK